jgi:histidinol-phosphate aminotransferase
MSPAAIATAVSLAPDTMYYCDPDSVDLRNRIANEFGVPCERIVVSFGIEALLELCVRAFVGLGDAAVTTAGTYPTFQHYVRCFGGDVHLVCYLESYRVNLDGLCTAAEQYAARLIYLVNPDNPTGSMIPPPNLRAFIRALPAGCMLLLDEAYIEFAQAEYAIPLDEFHPNVVRMRTFSKAYGLAGARVGYAVADTALLRTVEQVRHRYGISKLSQEMALAAFQDREFLLWILEETAAARNHYYEIARGIGADPVPSSANFVAFDFGNKQRAKAVADYLEQRDILVSCPTQPPVDSLIRITAAPNPVYSYLAEVLRDAKRRVLR